MLRRYVHGPSAGADDPLIWYEGSLVDASTRRFLHADRLGSIVSITSYNGTWWAINSYDEYGIPYDGQGGAGPANQGRFQYTGQAWLPELGMYYYKARMYSPTLGRFMQTDPIGYEDQWNLYAYVRNDPVNMVDASGERAVTIGRVVFRVVVKGQRIERVVSEVGKDALADWHELDADSDASFGEQLGSFADLIVGTDFNSPSVFPDKKRGGIIDGDLPEAGEIGDGELEDGIGELNESVRLRRQEQREAKDRHFERGGSPHDPKYRDNQSGHAERISREETLRRELEARLKTLNE